MNKKNIGIVLLTIGIIGFFYFNSAKKNYLIYGERYSLEKLHQFDIELKKNNNYTFFFWAVDEETGIQTWADMQMFARLVSAEGQLIEQKETLATASEETGGVRRAQNGFNIKYFADIDQKVIVEIDLKSGDYTDIEVFENLPEGIDIYPGISLILGLFGLVLFLRGRASKA